MKNTIILSLVCLGLGFAAGWVAKPAPDFSTAAAPDTTPAKSESRRSTNPPASSATESDRKKTSLNSFVIGGDDQIKEFDAETRQAMANSQKQWGEMFKKRQMDKIDARIAKLTTELNLTPAQQAELRKLLETKSKGMESMLSGTGDMSKVGDLASLMNGGVDEALKGLLTPEQEEAHEALQKRELANKVEASALKNLAKLSYLDLSQEQKDAAYDILYADAEKSAGKTSSQNAMVSAMTEGMGIELDMEDLGISGALEMENAGNSSERPNPADIMAKMKESQAKRVAEKVEALRPVLNETQLEAYRKNLESKSGGILGGMLGGFGGGSDK